MIPSDKTLQHLPVLIDVDKMRSVFQRQLFSDGSQTISQCYIERIKYKPAKNCQVCYRLIVESTVIGYRSEQRIYARCFEAGGAITRYGKACQGLVDGHDLKKSVLHIPELDTVAWVFPYDRKLHHLDKVDNSQFLGQTDLPELISKRFGIDWMVDECRPEIIRYIPEHTCTVRAKFKMVHQSSGARRDLLLYGKTYYNDDGERTYSLMRQLWDSPACREERLRIPEPLTYQPQLKMLWQHSVPGVLLSEFTADGATLLENIAQAAQQIACLHQQRIEGCIEYGSSELSRELNKVGCLLRVFDPPYRLKVDRLIESLLGLLPTIECEQRAVLHGDLHLKNILCHNDGVYLIDLDNLNWGDPLQEIGSFVAMIINLSLVTDIPAELVDPTIKSFLVGYGDSVPWPISETRLRWHIAAALIYQRLYRGFTRLKPGRMEILDDLVGTAECLLDPKFCPSWLPRDCKVVCAEAS